MKSYQRLLTATILGAILIAGAGWILWNRDPITVAIGIEESVFAPAEVMQSVETELRLAEAPYQQTIDELEAITTAGSATLDPETAAAFEDNLTVIDGAIAESRAALDAAPTNEVAQYSLFGALQTKVALLQDYVALINALWQGDSEDLARILNGLNS